MSSLQENAVNRTVEAIVRDHIHGVTVNNVIVDRVFDGQDDTISVSVIYDGATGKLDAAETSQIGRHVWKKLLDMGVTAFPSFSFIAKSEAGKLAAA